MNKVSKEALIQQMREQSIALISIYDKLALMDMNAANGTLDQCVEYMNDKRALPGSENIYVARINYNRNKRNVT